MHVKIKWFQNNYTIITVIAFIKIILHRVARSSHNTQVFTFCMEQSEALNDLIKLSTMHRHSGLFKVKKINMGKETKHLWNSSFFSLKSKITRYLEHVKVKAGMLCVCMYTEFSGLYRALKIITNTPNYWHIQACTLISIKQSISVKSILYWLNLPHYSLHLFLNRYCSTCIYFLKKNIL